MLVLSRKKGEAIRIGDQIRVVVVEGSHGIRIGIEAPRDINIVREELLGPEDADSMGEN